MTDITDDTVADHVRTVTHAAHDHLASSSPTYRRVLYVTLWLMGERIPPDSSVAGLRRDLLRTARRDLETR
jgi:hypothetical protein